METTTDNNTEVVKKPKWFKKIVRTILSTLFLLTISTLLLVCYHSWTQQKILQHFNEKTPKVDFVVENIDVSLYHNVLMLQEVKVNLLKDTLNKEIQGKYELSSIQIKGFDFIDWLFYDSLKINYLEIKNDEIFHELIERPQTQKKIAWQQNLKIDSVAFVSTKIKIKKENRIHLAQKSSLLFKNLKVDSTNLLLSYHTVQAQLDDYTLIQESDTLFSSKNIGFQGHDSTLVIEGLNYHKQDIFINKVALTNIEIQKYLETQSFALDSFYIKEAYVDLHTISTQKRKENLANINLRKVVPKLLEPFCKELKIRKFLVDKSDVQFQNETGHKKINNININLSNIHIHSESYLDKNKVLFADSIRLGFEDFVTGNQHYSLSFLLGNINVTSNDTVLYFYDFFYQKEDKLIFFIPQLSIKNIDWKLAWRENKLHIESLLFQSPEFGIYASKQNKLRNTPKSLNKIIAEVGEELKVDNVQVRNASFFYTNRNKNRPLQKAEINKLNLNLANIYLTSDPNQKVGFHDLLDQIKNLRCNKFSAQLQNNTSFKVENIKLSEDHKNFVVENIHAQQLDNWSIETNLLDLKNIDWDHYWNTNELKLDEITLHKPYVTLKKTTAQNKGKKTPSSEKKKWQKILPNLTNKFAKNVRIQAININEGTFNMPSQKLQNINLSFQDFVLDTAKTKQAFYSKNLLLGTDKYHFYNDKINFSIDSISSTVLNKKTKLYGINFLQKDSTTTLESEGLVIQNIDWNKLWNKDKLAIYSIELLVPSIKVQASKKKQKKTPSTPLSVEEIEEQLMNSLQKMPLKEIDIEQIKIKDANLQASNPKNAHKVQGIDFVLNQLFIDTTQAKFKDYNLGASKYQFKQKNLLASLEKINFSSTDSSLKAYRFHLGRNKELSIDSYKASIENIDTKTLINKQRLVAGRIHLASPQIQFNERKKDSTKTTTNWSKIHQKLHFKEIDIQSAQAKIKTLDSNSYQFSSDIIIKDFVIDSTQKLKAHFSDFDITLHNFENIDLNSFYQRNFKKAQFKYLKQELLLEDFDFKLRVSPMMFFSENEKKKGIYDIQVPKIALSKFDYKLFLEKQDIRVEEVLVKKARFDIFSDRRIAREEHYVAKMPNDWISSLKNKIDIDSILILDSDIIYREQVFGADSIGELSFNRTSLKIGNFYNQVCLTPCPLIIKGETYFMNEGLLTANFEFDLSSPTLNCRYTGTLGNMSVLPLNRILSPVTPISLTDGQINMVNVEGIMTSKANTGKMYSTHRNIKIKVQNKEGKKGRKFLSALGNLFLNNNQKKRKKVSIYYEKDKTDNFFRFLWKGIRKGLESALLPIPKK